MSSSLHSIISSRKKYRKGKKWICSPSLFLWFSSVFQVLRKIFSQGKRLSLQTSSTILTIQFRLFPAIAIPSEGAVSLALGGQWGDPGAQDSRTLKPVETTGPQAIETITLTSTEDTTLGPTTAPIEASILTLTITQSMAIPSETFTLISTSTYNFASTPTGDVQSDSTVIDTIPSDLSPKISDNSTASLVLMNPSYGSDQANSSPYPNVTNTVGTKMIRTGYGNSATGLQGAGPPSKSTPAAKSQISFDSASTQTVLKGDSRRLGLGIGMGFFFSLNVLFGLAVPY